MNEQLQQYVASKENVRVERRFASDPRLNGFLVAVSPELAVMHCFHDFMPDGFSVIRLEDVVNVRSGKYERHWKRMLQQEGLLSALEAIPVVDLSSMRSAIDSIASQYKGLIIECEDDEGDDIDFYIGAVLSSSDSQISIHAFDALGVWDSQPSEVPVEEISLVQFDTPYLNTFWKYLAGPRTNHDLP
ncbi:MAG: hypothetical protein KDA61_22510 [Planctomycetales bacterium]|nr:hypothetical protein [Planctomycetales bacterium]